MKHYREYLNSVSRSVEKAGATVPAQRRAFATHSFRGAENELQIWDWIWNNSNDQRLMTQSIFFAETLTGKAYSKEASAIVLQWQDRVSNWWHCDGLAKVYTKFLEHEEASVLPLLKAWNSHDDPWKRRQSVVSLLYYSRTKKKVLAFDIIVPLIDSLLEDREYYVQKGIGWTIRELYNVYPSETLKLMKDNYRRISGTAFSAATEKLQLSAKEELKQLRKDQRNIFA